MLDTAVRLYRALVLGRVPNYVIAFVTGRCNMNCTFCCSAARTLRGVDELSPSQWGTALAGSDALVHLTITGGEPFLRDDLLDVISCMVRSSGVPRLSINSNGYFPGRTAEVLEEILTRFPHLETCLTISLDGPRAVHDRLRGVPDGFDRARATVDAVAPLRRRHEGFTVRLTSVLQPGNAEVLGGFQEETAAWPIDFHELALVRDVAPEVQRSLAGVYAELTARQLRRASRRYVQTMDWRLATRLRHQVLERLEPTAEPFGCMAGWRMVEVMADGTVRGCELAQVRSHSVLGRAGVGGVRVVEVLEDGPARRFRAVASDCTCTFECALTCSTVFSPRAWPGLWFPRRRRRDRV